MSAGAPFKTQMMVFKLTRLMLVAALGLLMVGNSFAYQEVCQMAKCCCRVDVTADLSIERSSCCGCEMTQADPIQVQPAIAKVSLKPLWPCPELAAASVGQPAFDNDNSFSGPIPEANSLSPPKVNNGYITPLRC